MSPQAALDFEAGPDFVAPNTPLDLPLRELDAWLTTQQNRPGLQEFDAKLIDIVSGEAGRDTGPKAAHGLVKDERWRTTRTRLWKSLIASTLAPISPEVSAFQLRLLLVVGLVETYAEEPAKISKADDPAEAIFELLHDRIVVVPAGVAPARSNLVRRPGFIDYFVVRDEWVCYLPGEIAHIENVLKGELKERTFKQTNETETTTTLETETRKTEERDTQTTERFEVSDEASHDTSLSAHVEGQVETSGQYGPTHVDTHIGGSLDYSVHDATQHASKQAQESVARAVTKVEQTVRQARTVRSLIRTEETDTHRFDNTATGSGHVVGMYRWVDKVQRLQMFRYPHRYVLEFEVPEPGAYVRWLNARHADRGLTTPEPEPLALDGQPLTPLAITESNYLEVAERYATLDVAPPPPTEVVVNGWLYKPVPDPSQLKTSIQLWQTPSEGGTSTGGSVDGQSVSVPDGYEATEWSGRLLSWDQNNEPKPDWNKTNQESYVRVAPMMFLSLADNYPFPGSRSPLSPPPPAGTESTVVVNNERSAIDKAVWGRMSGARTGKLPITVMAANDSFVSVYVHVRCVRKEPAVLKWQFETFEKIRAAYFELKRRHDEEKAARTVAEGVVIEGESPERNRDLVHQELRRQVIELLLSAPTDPVSNFAGEPAIVTDPMNPATPPRISPKEAATVAPLIQFLEQSLEWNNLTYVLYPYYWSDSSEWPDLLDVRSSDPDFASFLRAGSARVIVPARPGFEDSVNYFIAFGQPWGGGPAPVPGDPLYISVAKEIRDQKGAPDEGEPGDSWEVKLPTTLVWLDPDSKLPKKNSATRLQTPANSLCPA